MAGGTHGTRAFWAIAAAVLAVFGFVVVSNNASSADPAPILCEGATPTVAGLTGTPGNDVIVGTAANDTINGLGGDDLICGLDGRDTINGGGGKDRLVGGPRGDFLNGGPGADHIVDDIADAVDGGTGYDCSRTGAGISIEHGCPPPPTTTTSSSTSSSTTSTTDPCQPPITGGNPCP